MEEKWLEGSLAERGLGVLIESRLSVSHQQALEPKGQTAAWGAVNTAQPTEIEMIINRDDYSVAFNVDMASS